MKRKILSLFFILVCLASLPACATPLSYSAKEIHGQIVDAETNQPIEQLFIEVKNVSGPKNDFSRGRFEVYYDAVVTGKGSFYDA